MTFVVSNISKYFRYEDLMFNLKLRFCDKNYVVIRHQLFGNIKTTHFFPIKDTKQMITLRHSSLFKRE